MSVSLTAVTSQSDLTPPWLPACSAGELSLPGHVYLTALDILGNWASNCTTQFTMKNCSLVLVTEVGPTWLAYEWSRHCGMEDSVEGDYTSVVTNLDTNNPGYIYNRETCDSWKC